MNGILQTLRAFGPTRLIVMGSVLAAMIGGLMFASDRLSQPNMALLYSNLDLQESAQIVTKLEGMKVPYRLLANGSQIMVPESQVTRLRLGMAESGLPSGGSVGYEIFDKSDSLGTTSFVQNINLTRALEGELARTIRAIDGVQNARVHLVLPKREVFSRESRDPSASIVLRMRGRIDKPQVRAIQNLVAAAVPDLKTSRISIVDDHGNLLASGSDERGEKSGAANFSDMRASQEERLRRAVETLLERSVGLGNVRAEVTADIDFDRITTNTEAYDPEGQVVRSTQSVTEQSNSAEGAPAVSVSSNLPSAAANNTSSQNQSRNQRNEETVNYEVTKTTKTQVREAGTVRRLSVAVLVNGSWKTEGEGKDAKRTFTPRSDAELKQLVTLARSAVGFDEKRGDTVEVIGMQFAEPDDLPALAPVEPGMFDFGKGDILRMVELAVISIVALLALLLVVRPIVMRLLSGAPAGGGAGGQLPALQATAVGGNGGQQQMIAGPDGQPMLAPSGNQTALAAPLPQGRGNNIDQMIDIARIEGQVKASSIKKIGEIVDNHPEEAVAIMRNWLIQGA